MSGGDQRGVMMLSRATKTEFDRTRVLEEAARARSKRQRSKAIRLYRWALAMEPRNAELHAKLAPLLAETGHHFEAWVSFRAVAKACLRNGLADKALAVYKEAALYLPREHQVWPAIAALQRRRGNEREAVESLIEGSRHLRTRFERPQAIHLLRRAREIEPWHFVAVLELARLLAGSEQRDEARILLHGLAAGADGERLKRVRRAQLRLDPGLRACWRWLRSLNGRNESVPPIAENPRVVPIRRAAQR
jgi:tetratricopeptide (TPR) repeat protein